MTLPQFEARVSVAPAAEWDHGDSELLEATLIAMRARRPEFVSTPGRFSFTTSIPRQVGLSGSSAIIMAALRALAKRSNLEWDPVDLARTTLEIETDVLGWSAGPQDRVVQAHEGLLDMDFAEPWRADGYVRLDPASLPTLYVAWSQTTGESSDVVHTNVRQRWTDGEPAVRSAMIRFAQLAALGRAALDAGTATVEWPSLLNEAFALRSEFWHITSVDTALVDAGRRAQAGVAFAGSGGAVVGALRDAAQLDAAAREYAAINAGFMVIHQ